MQILGGLPFAFRGLESIPSNVLSLLQSRQLSSDVKRIAAEQRGKQQASASVPDAVRAADVRWDSHQAQQRIEASKKQAQEKKSASLIQSVLGERNPRVIKEAREKEQERLSALRREIEADIRIQQWSTPKN